MKYLHPEYECMRTVYAVSSSFPYNSLISRDAGPSFASDYGWETIELKDFKRQAPGLAIIDNRLQVEDLELLRAHIAGSNQSLS